MSETETFPCPHCNIGFKSETKLIVHKNLQHPGRPTNYIPNFPKFRDANQGYVFRPLDDITTAELAHITVMFLAGGTMDMYPSNIRRHFYPESETLKEPWEE